MSEITFQQMEIAVYFPNPKISCNANNRPSAFAEPLLPAVLGALAVAAVDAGRDADNGRSVAAGGTGHTAPVDTERAATLPQNLGSLIVHWNSHR